MWIKEILKDLNVEMKEHLKLLFDNNSTTSISHNPVHHDRKKHVTIECHFVKEILETNKMCSLYIASSEPQADLLTKGLPTEQFRKLIGKLELLDIHSV